MKPRTTINSLHVAFAAIALAVGILAISDTTQARKALPETSPEGLKLVPKTKLSAVYLRDGVNFSGYDKVMILDCYVAFKKNWQRDQNSDTRSPRVSDDDVTRIKTDLAEEFKKVFTKELTAKGQTVVTAPGSDVLILRPAVIDLDVTSPDTMDPGITRSYSATAGQATLFLELYDSVTSELLARVYDAEQVEGMGGYFSVRNKASNYTDAERMLKKWAGIIGTHLQAARESGGTPAK
ncbi:MAG TPA: DUF3313 family protein [Povalibacter sp.]